MAQDNEEDDYMSDTILAVCAAKDVRPSLLHKRADKRKLEVLLQQRRDNEDNKRRCKPIRVQEQESREAGLNKEIGSDNKGFQLLSKMGYKPGTSLGKPGGGGDQEDKGLKEPIPLQVKTDRKGLGQKRVEVKEKRDAFNRHREELDKLMDPVQFRIRAQAAATLREMERDLKTAQSSCRHLDTQKGKESPSQVWHWPVVEQPKKLDPDDEPSNTVVEVDEEPEECEEPLPEVHEMLQDLTEYLRKEYFYCVWCGTSFEDWEDLSASCPGNAKDLH